MRRAMKQIAHVRQLVDQPMSLMDFGAGSGSFVRAAIDQGWEATGVERSTAARERAKQFYGVELVERIDENQRFDVITMWDVVEHLRDPREVLSMLLGHLSPNGILFIETGNYENWQRVVERDKWGLYLFDHQFYFSPSSLQQVMQSAGFNGFRLLDCNHARPRVLKNLLRPAKAARSWMEWMRAKSKWPEHGDMDVMIVAGSVEPANAQMAA